MKKFLSILITILMLMQMFTFSVSSEEANLTAYWTGEGPGEIAFPTVEGMNYYEIKLYKDGKLVEETSHSIGNYVITELRHSFLDEIVENGKGVYKAEVIYEDGVSVETGNYRYIAPSTTLQKPDYIEFNQEKNYIVWGEVADAVLYEVKFVFSLDGGNSFFDMNSYQLVAEEDGTYFDFWGNAEDELKWIEESYEQAMIDHETTAENFIRAVQVVAYPAELNNANPSYSDYVTFDGITIPDSGDEPIEDGTYSYMEIVDYQNEYYIGQEFYAELRLVYVSSDGTETYTTISSKDCEVEGFDPYTSGWQEVTIWYGDEFVTCDVLVMETDVTVPDYQIRFDNAQIEYAYGEDFYVEVYEITADGQENRVYDYKVEGFDPYTPGWQVVTVTYGDYSEEFKAHVIDPEGEPEEPTICEVRFENVATEYQLGEDFYIEAYLVDTEGNVYRTYAFEVDGFDRTRVGQQEVTVSFGDYSETYVVYVNENTGTDGTIGYIKASMPNVEFFPGDEFYAEVYVYTPDGSCYQIEDYKYEGFDSYTPGEQIVTIWYGNLSTTVTVWVYEEEPVEPVYTVEFENVKTEYEYGEEFYIEVYRYIDGEKIAVSNDEWWVEGFDRCTPGWQEVTVFCENRVETYEVYVNEKEDTDRIAEVYWTGERPAQIYFTFVPGVKTYSIKVLKDDKEIYSDTRDFKRYDRDEGGKFSLRDVILENGEGIYQVGVAPVFDGFMDTGKYTLSEMLIYREPEDILPCVNGVTYNLDTYEIMWTPIEEAAEYDVVFCYSPDGGEHFYPVTAYGAEEDGYFNFYGEAEYELQWLEEEYASYAKAEGLAVEDLIMAVQIKAFPLNLNDAAPSASKYVIFWETEPVPGIRDVRVERLKKQYYEGEEIEAEIWYETEDGRHEFTEDFEVEGYDAYFIGEQNVTISFGGYSEDFTVTVKPRPIIDENVTHIRIKNFKTLYYLGEEFEAEVYAYRDDGSCYMVEDYLYYDFDSSIIGDQSVMVRYGDFTDACIVCVYEEELTESLSGTCGDNLTWVLDTNGVLTISGTGAMENYENTNGMPWYDNRGRIKEIIIEEGVTSIGRHAFAWCYGLTNVIIPYSVTEISDYAFYACTTLPYIMIPDNATIGSFAFSSCKRIENVDFGSNVIIGEWAFSSCESLTNVNIHADMIMGDCVFRYCESLENINVDDSNPYYCSIDGNLFNKDKTTLIQYAIGKRDTHYEIPYGVTTIGEAAFDTCTKLTSITIPNSVTSVYEYAFRDCKNLVDVYYNGTSSEFYSIVVNGNNEPLYDAAIHFIETPGPIYHVTFENVKTEYNIGEEFYIEVYEYTAEGNKIELSGWTVDGFDSSVPGEQTVTVRYGDYEEVFVVYVDGEITPEPAEWEYDEENRELIIKFNGDMPTYQYDLNAGYTEAPWDYLRDEVEIISIWDGVTNISDGAFVRFTNLREVNMGSTVRRIGASVFEECRNLTYITIPDSVEYIGPRAFRASGLETIHFGENVRTIGSAAFMGSMLTRVELPESLGIIPSSVFASCKHLSEIYIPSSVHSIQPTAFNYCTELTDVYFDGTEEEWNNIAITSGNEPLYNANIYFNGEELTKTISIENVKTEYEYGEEFYAEIWIETSDGNRWQTYDFEVIDFDPYTVGWQTVIIRIEDREEPFDVYVRGDEVEEPYIVSVDFELLKDTYYRGEELKVYVYENMSDGTCNRVYDYEVVNFDSTRLGQQMVTINYKGFGKQFYVMVEERPASGGGGGGSDGTGPVITVSQEKGRVGNTVDVEVSISENTGFMNLGLEIEYDSGLKLVGVTEHNIGATFTGAQSLDVYPYNFNFSSTGDVAYNGTLVTLTFEIPEDAQAGDYFVGVDFYKGRDGNYIDGDSVNYDADENPLNLRYEDGFINVYNYIPGDINGNGVVDNKDGTALLRHLAGWTLEQIDYNALDVDGNGTVDNKDGTRLLRYLAGWDVEVY